MTKSELKLRISLWLNTQPENKQTNQICDELIELFEPYVQARIKVETAPPPIVKRLYREGISGGSLTEGFN
jgi:hypothetical protein